MDTIFNSICVGGNSYDADRVALTAGKLVSDSIYDIFVILFNVLVNGNHVNGYSANSISD